MLLDRINLKDDKTLGKQVQLLVGIQQVIILAAFVIRLQYIKKIGNVKVFFPYLFFYQHASVISLNILVKTIERRKDVIALDLFDIAAYGIGQCHFLGAGGRLVITFP
ncbi:hypothetical protein D3C87_1636530 [compost metagenome]